MKIGSWLSLSVNVVLQKGSRIHHEHRFLIANLSNAELIDQKIPSIYPIFILVLFERQSFTAYQRNKNNFKIKYLTSDHLKSYLGQSSFSTYWNNHQKDFLTFQSLIIGKAKEFVVWLAKLAIIIYWLYWQKC